MLPRHAGFWIILASLALLAPPNPATAHVPEHGANGATVHVEDPTVSRVFYETLDDEEEQLTYTFELREGQRLVLEIMHPAGAPVLPAVELQGPQGPLEQPPVAEGEPTYEVFGPSVLVPVWSVDRPAPATGTYTVTIDADGSTGPVGFVIGGDEAFTLTEWARVPVAVAKTHVWSGQPWALVLAPTLVLLLGGGVALSQPGRISPSTTPGWMAAIAGLLALGASATWLVQMLLAVPLVGVVPGMLVTLGIAVAQAAVGAGLLARAPHGVGDVGARLWLGGLALASLATWAGWLVGPALALAAGVWPTRPPTASQPVHGT